MPSITQALFITRVLSTRLATVVALSLLAGGVSAEGRFALTDEEVERRLQVCHASEAWLRQPCLRAVSQMRRDASRGQESRQQVRVSAPVDELHMVGIYEPLNRVGTGGQVSRGEVMVHVDRPGQNVGLAIGAYEPTRWIVIASPGTKIAQVVVLGHGASRSEVVLADDGTPVARNRMSVPHDTVGSTFQPFHKAVSAMFRTEKAASFHGAYRAPEAGFLISDAPGVPTQDEMWEALFEQARDRTTLSAHLQSVLAGDTSETGMWTFSEAGFIGVDAQGQAAEHPITLDVPDVSWPVAAAYNPERELLWGITLGGEGYLYEYDVREDRWRAWSMDNFDASGLLYDNRSGRLISLGRNFRHSAIVTLDRRANVLTSVPLVVKRFSRPPSHL